MRDSEIREFMIDEPWFKGVFASDDVTLPSQAPAGIIINTDNRGQPGEHWTALFIKSDLTCEYFDPYGISPVVPHIILVIKNFKQCTYNSTQIQSSRSNSCGLFCIGFLKSRFRGMKMLDFVALFDGKNNERIIKDVVEAYE